VSAETIFSGLDQLCRSVTRHYYEVTLGISLQSVMLVPAAEFSQETGQSEARAQAFRDFFAALQQPGRYFRLATPGPVPASIEFRVCLSDTPPSTGAFWSIAGAKCWAERSTRLLRTPRTRGGVSRPRLLASVISAPAKRNSWANRNRHSSRRTGCFQNNKKRYWTPVPIRRIQRSSRKVEPPQRSPCSQCLRESLARAI
jgi:hypothetical protein